jgi:predicted LPLAT superfamily acyltransferase
MSTPGSPERRGVAAGLLALALSSNRKPAATREAYRRAGLTDDPMALDRLVVANLLFTVGYYARCWALLCGPGRQRLRRTVRPAGDGHLRKATADGRGAILLAVHLGDFDLAGHWVASEFGRRLVVASPPVWPAWRGAVYEKVRSRAGFRVRRQDQTTLQQLADDLRANQLVLFLADRRPPGRPLYVTFVGRRSVLSAAPSWLSAHTGAPIISAATFSEGRQRQLIFGPPRWASEPSDHRWVAPALAELELSIRRTPHEWHIPADLQQLAVSAQQSLPLAAPALAHAGRANAQGSAAASDGSREFGRSAGRP